MKRQLAGVIVLALMAIHLLGVVALAEQPQALFITSDRGDVLFLEKLGLTVEVSHCVPLGDMSRYSIIFVLDYNVGESGCHNWPAGFLADLLKAAERGAVVVIGLNTLRALTIYEPRVVKALGLMLQWEAKRIHSIFVPPSLSPDGASKRLTYNSFRYARYLTIPHSTWKVLARFDDGMPAIIEQSMGKGRLVIMFFNPVWPALEGYRGYTDLIRGLYSYYAGHLTVTAAEVAAAATAAGAAAISYTAFQRSDEIARRAGRPLVLAFFLAHRIKKSKLHEHPVRQKIFSILNDKYYITVQDLLAFGVKRSSALWHLELLVSLGMLSVRKIAGKIIYYRKENYREALLAFLMESEHRRRIIEELSSGVLTLTKLAERLNISKSTVKHHIDLLMMLDVVKEIGYGYTLSEWAYDLLERVKVRKQV